MPIVAVLGAHWGDEGKGKIAAALSARADVCARFQGGPNAGHSVTLGDSPPWLLRMVPSGILTGATGIIGGGCVIDPELLMQEIALLQRTFPDVLDRLLISRRAHVITAEHKTQDRAGSGVGSTRTGVGPTYRDKAARTGIRVADLVADRPSLPGALQSVAHEFRESLSHRCADEIQYLRGVLDRGGRVIAEGAQGARLDLDHGDYPYVTSSNTTIGSVLTGLGVGPPDISAVLLVTPSYVTKVGGGPLPSRVDSATNLILRTRGQELDGVTNLMRETGWLDLGWLRRACRLNQATGIVMTKVDVLAGLKTIGLYDEAADPIVRILPGWDKGEVATADESEHLGSFLCAVEKDCGTPVAVVSHGPRPEDWWWRTDADEIWRNNLSKESRACISPMPQGR
jgi:adenylosuccinate synthase